MEQNKATGHLSALLTILIWGTSFISAKVLLALPASLRKQTS